MRSYARFNPALDAAGNPTTGSYTTTIVYQLN
jgi:protein TonB